MFFVKDIARLCAYFVGKFLAPNKLLIVDEDLGSGVGWVSHVLVFFVLFGQLLGSQKYGRKDN